MSSSNEFEKNNKKQQKSRNERTKSKEKHSMFCCFMPTHMMSSEEASISGESADSLKKKPDLKEDLSTSMNRRKEAKEHCGYKASSVDLDNAKTVKCTKNVNKEKRKSKKNAKKQSNHLEAAKTSEDTLYQENEYQQGEGGPESMSYDVNAQLNVSKSNLETAATTPRFKIQDSGVCNEFERGSSNCSGGRDRTSTERESSVIVSKDKVLYSKSNSKIIKTSDNFSAQTVTQMKDFDGNSREKDICKFEFSNEKGIEKPLQSDEVPISEDEEDLYSANTDVLQGAIGSDEQYDSIGKQRLKSVGSQHDVIHYAKEEWKSETEKAQSMRQGYEKVHNNGYKFLRRIRGDNYCAIRATLYQALVKGLPILEKWKNTEKITEKLCRLEWMQHWSFGGRLGQVNTLQKVKQKLNYCLKILQNEYKYVCENRDNCEEYMLNLFNSPKETDVLLMEGIKILMMYNAIHLHRSYIKEEQVPMFVWLIFARDTSPNPRTLMLNHLNNVGSQGGLEQVEMCLLGNTLEISIKVMRPLQHSQQDFISMYPDDCKTCPNVTLIAEDDRHYNIVYN